MWMRENSWQCWKRKEVQAVGGVDATQAFVDGGEPRIDLMQLTAEGDFGTAVRFGDSKAPRWRGRVEWRLCSGAERRRKERAIDIFASVLTHSHIHGHVHTMIKFDDRH